SLYEHPELEIVPCFQDRSRYATVHDLVDDVKLQGYFGGIRVMKATIRKFVGFCDQHGLPLHDRNFSIRYRSNIPRRVGLAGSSALVTATLRCLMEFYDVEIPKHIQPGLILSVEMEELGISAGLQDRVIQVYEGCVYMDFTREFLEGRGYGEYEPLDPALLPPLFVAYRADLAEGSEVTHNNIRERWNQGDPEVIQAMRDFASYAQAVRELLVAGRGREIGPWMDKNFDRRRSIYKLDPRQVEMIERARGVGAHAKFAGSGGAILGTYEDEDHYRRIVEAFEETGTKVIKPQVTELA
ncbi:MAG: GHMP kinase, partial [FCB group bacterium]|nr:GHMP kinase [FCB group bacterium]